MKNYYQYDNSLKKELLRKYTGTQVGFRKRNAFGRVLIILSVLTVFGLTCIFTFGSGEGASGPLPIPLIGFLTGLAFGCIPFFIGRGIHYAAVRRYGSPYGDMTKEFLGFDEDGLEFGYHHVSCPYSTGMDVYSISFADLNRVRFDSELCVLTIVGKGRLTAYDDYMGGVVNEEKSGRKFYSNSEFSFMLPFEEREEIVKLLRTKQRWEE